MVEKLTEKLVELEDIRQAMIKAMNDLMTEAFLVETEGANLGQQVKDKEETIQKLNDINQKMNDAYNRIVQLASYQLVPELQQELSNTRESYLESETDTAREAVEIIERFLMNPDNPRDLNPALSWMRKQVPPTVKETQYIDFETARIKDPNLNLDEEHIEIEGIKGEYKITYEINQIDGVDERTEIARKLVKSSVTEVIRVGTKPLEEEE